MSNIINIDELGIYIENPANQQSATPASATLDFNGTNPSDGNYIDFNGSTFTFKNSPSAASDVQIGSDISATLDNLLANPNLPTDVIYDKIDSDKLYIEYKETGTAGNSWTISCDFVTLPSSLSGGSDQPDPDWVQFDAKVNFKPFELLLDAADTTSASLYSYDYNHMKEGNKILLIDSGNNIAPFKLGAITTSGTLKTLDPNHVGSNITLDSTHNIATRNSDSNSNANSQIYGYAIDKGNVYWEVEYLANENLCLVGISTDNTYQDDYFPYVSSGYGYHYNGLKYNNNTSQNYGAAYGIGDRIGVRYCYETGELEFYKNGVSQGIAYTLSPNTIVYPAIRTEAANAQVQLFSDPTTMKHLPEECIPYGMLQYSADITAANLSNAPARAFMDNRPLVLASMEAEESDLVPVATEKFKTVLAGSTESSLNTGPVIVGEELIVDGNEIAIIDSKLNLINTVNDPDPLEDSSQVAMYRFEDDANGGVVTCDNDSSYNGQWKDSSDNNIDGVYTTGKFGNAADLSGDDKKIVTGLTFDSNGNKSLSFWVYMIEAHGEGMLFCQDGSDSPSNYIAFDVDGLFSIARNNSISFKANTLSYGEWHHIVVQDDGSEVSVYFNGIKRENENYFYNSIYGLQISNFGFYPNDPGTHSAHCYMDQVRIFNRALTDDEIAILYKEQKAKYDISTLGLSEAPHQVISKGYVELAMDSSDTSSFTGYSIHSLTPKNGDNILTDYGVVQISNDPTIETVDTVSNPQPLLNGSQITGYTFDSTTNSMNSSTYDAQFKVKDSSGNYQDGTAVYSTGKFGNAVSFDGSNTHIIQFHNPYNVNDIFTVSAWFKWNGTQNQYVIMEAGEFQIPGSIDSSGNIRLDYPYDPGVYGTTAVNDGAWHHICVIHNLKGTDVCYIDGVRDSVRRTNTIGAYLYWNIGQYANSTANYEMDGLIDQVRIFNGALSKEEINVLYNEQISKYTLPLPSQSAAYQFAAIPPRTVNVPRDTLTFDGTKFNHQHKVVQKQGRSIQRRLVIPGKHTEILPPFVSYMWKI